MDRPVINFSVELYFRRKCTISASHRAGSPPPPCQPGEYVGEDKGMDWRGWFRFSSQLRGKKITALSKVPRKGVGDRIKLW